MTQKDHILSIDLENLETISRGDDLRKLRYLEQFRELIPERSKQLKIALEDEDRVLIRQILHKMSPQLQFFGVKGVIIPIQRLEFEYQSMPELELNQLVTDIIRKLEVAVNDVVKLINSTH